MKVESANTLKKIVFGEERSVQGSQRRNPVLPPAIEGDDE